MCICYLSSMEEHKGHDMISVAAESNEKELGYVSVEYQPEKAREREKDVKVFHQEVKSINHCTEDSDTIVTLPLRKDGLK